MAQPIMSIVGFGPMGKLFTHLFSQDFSVYVSSSRPVKNEVASLGAVLVSDRQKIMSKAKYIFLAIPLKALPELIEEVNVHASADVVVIDCCSARIPAEQALENLHRQHFGMHDVKNGEYCITGTIDDGMADFFLKNDIPIVPTTAEEHDRINSIIGLGHFIALSLECFLSVEEKELLSGNRSGSTLLSLANRMALNSSTTWRETQIDNQFTKHQRELFLNAMNRYHQALSDGKYPFTV
ncbi:MAG: hypothetical protein D6B25_13980 [Desulfobulbaceae bacterium]|nr:MAG: hypothetical protein D6B25_13980 [Desulfobulbaceae bacterium]